MPSTPAGVLPATIRDRAGQCYAVRRYTDGDWEALVAFYEQFEPKRAAQGLPPQGTARIERWLRQVIGSGIHLLICPEEDVLAHAFLVSTRKPRTAEYAVFVHQNYRGQCLGTELNRVAAKVAGENGFQRLWLSVEPQNRAAIRSYQHVGFRFRPGAALSSEAEMELELTETGPALPD